jgi:hypothetical protein
LYNCAQLYGIAIANGGHKNSLAQLLTAQRVHFALPFDKKQHPDYKKSTAPLSTFSQSALSAATYIPNKINFPGFDGKAKRSSNANVP